MDEVKEAKAFEVGHLVRVKVLTNAPVMLVTGVLFDKQTSRKTITCIWFDLHGQLGEGSFAETALEFASVRTEAAKAIPEPTKPNTGGQRG